MTQELMDCLDAALKMSDTGKACWQFYASFRRRATHELHGVLSFDCEVLRQMDTNGVKSTTPAGHCRLTPLVPLILDCTFLYHFSVLLLFKLHSRECWTNVLSFFILIRNTLLRPGVLHLLWFVGIAADVLLGHRERFRDLFMR